MKAGIIIGVRPDLICNSIFIQKMKEWLGEDFFFAHTNQHYDWNMNQVFFEQLDIVRPDYHLGIADGNNNWQSSEIIKKSGGLLSKINPNLLISFSDANACQSAIAAKKIGIKVAHFESGMRSFDTRMCEEWNRRMVDSISDYFFTPTQISAAQLMSEGHDSKNIFVVNKQIIDVIEKFKNRINRDDILEKLGTNGREYMLVELHRPENTENKENLVNILKGLKEVYDKYELDMIAPLHRRTQNALKEFGLWGIARSLLRIVDSIGFFEFEKLTSEAKCCISDSGTIQETGAWYRTPVVVCRPSTERQEAIEAGFSILVGEKNGTFNPITILRGVEEMMERRSMNDLKCPYETGATDKIINILKDKEDDILKPKILWND